MWEFITYGLGAISAVLFLAAGLITVHRVIPKLLPADEISELRARIATLELTFQGFADQYELSVVRNTAKIGKLRRQLARERGDDPEEEEEPQTAPVVNAVPPTPADLKTELRRRAGLS